jgi:curved DNA-binding protein CbpA
MRRLSQLVKDKTELIDSAQKLRIGINNVEGLETSGLSKQMIQHLENWVDGVESGRECMFALLDSMHSTKDITPPMKAGQFKPLEVVQSLLNLPAQFLCDNGYLFERVFSRPPATVVKEAVQIIVKKAEEQNSSSLGLQQINLALKQLRLDAMCCANPIEETAINDAVSSLVLDLNTEDANQEEKVEIEPILIEDHVRIQIVLRVKIITELLRIHIKTTAKRKNAALSSRNPSRNRKFELWNEEADEEENSEQTFVDIRSLREFVSTTVQEVQQNAMKSPAESLEQTNIVLKPYLRQLSSLKLLLTNQLNELRDSKAFLALGLSSDATDEDIKKAYRILAVRLHPDKPGGDTAKFQQLQAMYQEVLKRRKTKREEEETVKSMREKRQQEQTNLRNSRNRQKKADDELQKSLEKEDEELEELLRNINTDMQKNSEDLAGFSKKKEQLRKKGGINESDKAEEEDKENMLEGSENEASPNDHSPDGAKDNVTTNSSETEESKTDNPERHLDEDDSCKQPEESSTSEDFLVVEDVDSDGDDLTAFTKKSLAEPDANALAPNSAKSTSAHNGSKFAAALLQLSLPLKPAGPFESDEAHAAALIQYTQSMLPLLHHAATKATYTVQKLIKWQKQWEKTFKDSSLSLSEVMEKLLQIAMQAMGGHVAFIDHISAPSTSTASYTYQETQRNRLLSAPIRAVAPALEVICDITQRIAATGMELASECGADFMQAIGMETHFLKEIEVTMNESLACLRGVVPIATSLDQLMSCLQRSYDTQRLTASTASSMMLDMLTDMMRTAMKNTVATHCGAVDSMMQAANAATHLSDRLKQLQEKVQRNVLLEAKRQADYERMRHEEEEEYSAEDRESIRRARQQPPQQQQKPPAAGDDGPNGEEESRKQGSEEEEDDEKNLTGLDLLKSKIRKLQVQLYLQQVTALQTMNAETVTLQENILEELQSLTLLAPGPRHQVQSQQPLHRIQGVNAEVVESVVSLVAEMLDASLAQFRQTYQQQRPSLLLDDTLPVQSSSSLELRSPSLEQHQVHLELRHHLDLDYVTQSLMKHLVWCIDIVLSDHSHITLRQLLVQAEFLSAVSDQGQAGQDNVSPTTSIDEEATSKEKEHAKMMPKVALLPDYRAKTLYLASVLDMPAIKNLLFTELPQKLQEILSE